jgi:hypothetical protein
MIRSSSKPKAEVKEVAKREFKVELDRVCESEKACFVSELMAKGLTRQEAERELDEIKERVAEKLSEEVERNIREKWAKEKGR